MKPRNLRILATMLLLLVALITHVHGYAAGGVSFIIGGLAVHALKPVQRYFAFAYTGTTLADIFVPQVYGTIQPNDSPESTAFVQSGAVVSNPVLQELAQQGAKLIDVPIWNDLDASVAPNNSDDTDTLATPGKIGVSDWKARNAFINKGYGAADLAVELSGTVKGDGNPMTRIRNRFGAYWAKQFQYRVIAACRGVLAANVANNSGDMLYSISQETTVGLSDSNRISAEAVVEAVFTLGDQFDTLKAIAMHSLVYKRLVLQQLIEYVKDADGKILYESYLGKRVVVDDGLPVIAGTTSGFKYISILFGTGAIGYGEGSPVVPAEIQRIANGGNGGGLENIWERKTWLIHPQGVNWTDASVAGVSPTLAELRLAANWTRLASVSRKVVKLAFLQTNG